MRLNGKAAIMRYLGYPINNSRAWVSAKLRYGRIIYMRDHGGHRHRYWTLAEWINQVDLEHSQSVYDAEYSKLMAQQDAATEHVRTAWSAERRERELVAA